ncbi:MAG: helix-turn-helix domain-containing protein [Anaerolineae bacterium]
MKGGKKARLLQGGWEASSTGAPLYQHVGRRGGRIIAYPDPPRGPLDPIPTVEKLWEFVESLSPFTGDVALAVLAQMGEPSLGDRPRYPLLQPVKINADAILRYKGLQRYGMERRLLRERVAEEMRRLQSLRFDVEKFPVYNPETRKWEGKGQSWRGDRLFDIVEVEQYQPDFWDGKEQVEIAWSVRAGQWAYYWLNAQGRAYVARMARALLELDHRENRATEVMAKKIGQRVALLSYGDKVLEFRIGKLLEDIGELIVPDMRPKDWAGRTKERFDEAMLALKEAGIFSDVQWPDGYGPGDPDRARGWPERWLRASVIITLPEQAPEPAPKELPALLPARKRPKRKPAKEQRISGAALRRTRIERNWRQAELAQALGISKGYLSAIETGKRLPSSDLAARIRAWMEQEPAN